MGQYPRLGRIWAYEVLGSLSRKLTYLKDGRWFLGRRLSQLITLLNDQLELGWAWFQQERGPSYHRKGVSLRPIVQPVIPAEHLLHSPHSADLFQKGERRYSGGTARVCQGQQRGKANRNQDASNRVPSKLPSAQKYFHFNELKNLGQSCPEEFSWENKGWGKECSKSL